MYVDTGTGEAVIFVHGIASTHATWEAVTAGLSQHCRCIRYDLRGHGAAAPEAAPSIDALVADLEALRQELGLGQIDLVGHSLGAFIAARYAVDYRARVRLLALLAAPAARSEAERAIGAKLIEEMKSAGVHGVMPRLIDSWYTPKFLSSYPDALARRLQQIYSLRDPVVIRDYELYYATELAPWLEQLALPTLVMTGQYARGCGAEVARSIVERLPDASLVILEGQRNGILTEVPERVGAELLRFFQTRGLRSPTGAVS